MRREATTILGAAVTLMIAGFWPPAIRAAAPPILPRDVIRLSLTAAGGTEALARLSHGYAKFKSIRRRGNVMEQIQSERWSSGDGKARLVERVSEQTKGFAPKSFTRILVIDGEKTWFVAPWMRGKLPNPLESLIAVEVKHVNEVTDLLALVKKPERYRVSFLREEKVGGHHAVTLKVATESMPDVLLSFDRQTWLHVKTVTTYRPLAFLAPYRFENVYSDFKTVEGCRVPMKRVTVDGDGGKAERLMLEYKHLKELDAKLFQEP